MASAYFKYIILKQLKYFKLNYKMKSNYLWLSPLCIFARQPKLELSMLRAFSFSG